MTSWMPTPTPTPTPIPPFTPDPNAVPPGATLPPYAHPGATGVPQTPLPRPTVTPIPTATNTPVPVRSTVAPTPTATAQPTPPTPQPTPTNRILWPVFGQAAGKNLGTRHGARQSYVPGARQANDPDTHTGIDIMADANTPVIAPEDGEIVEIGSDRLYGTYLVFKGNSGRHYRMAHLNDANKNLRNVSISAGTHIGLVGSTGNSDGPHLHFEVYSGPPGRGNAVDPLGKGVLEFEGEQPDLREGGNPPPQKGGNPTLDRMYAASTELEAEINNIKGILQQRGTAYVRADGSLTADGHTLQERLAKQQDRYYDLLRDIGSQERALGVAGKTNDPKTLNIDGKTYVMKPDAAHPSGYRLVEVGGAPGASSSASKYETQNLGNGEIVVIDKATGEVKERIKAETLRTAQSPTGRIVAYDPSGMKPGQSVDLLTQSERELADLKLQADKAESEYKVQKTQLVNNLKDQFTANLITKEEAYKKLDEFEQFWSGEARRLAQQEIRIRALAASEMSGIEHDLTTGEKLTDPTTGQEKLTKKELDRRQKLKLDVEREKRERAKLANEFTDRGFHGMQMGAKGPASAMSRPAPDTVPGDQNEPIGVRILRQMGAWGDLDQVANASPVPGVSQPTPPTAPTSTQTSVSNITARAEPMAEEAEDLEASGMPGYAQNWEIDPITGERRRKRGGAYRIPSFAPA